MNTTKRICAASMALFAWISLVDVANAQYSKLQSINVNLTNWTHQDELDVFDMVLNSTRDVYKAELFLLSPRRGAVWLVSFQDTDPPRLQKSVITVLQNISRTDPEIMLRGTPYPLSEADVDFLKAIRPRRVTPEEVIFEINRKQIRDDKL